MNGKWGLGCSVCRASGQSGKFSGALICSGGVQSLKLHSNANMHKLALQDLGVLDAAVPATAFHDKHPPIADFMKVLQRRESGHSLRSGVVDVAGRFKITQMQWCLAEADRSRAKSIAIAQDCRQNVLLMRYSACNESLVNQRFPGGSFCSRRRDHHECGENNGGPAPEVLHSWVWWTLAAAARLRPSKDLLCCYRFRCRRGKQRARGGASKQVPGLLTVQRDRPHAATRLFKRPWNADAEIKETVNMCTSVCQKIQHSPALQAVFASLVTSNASCPTSCSRVKSLQSAKHGFASLSQPLGRFILHWDAILGTVLWIHAKRDGDDKKFAVQALSDWTETKLILVAMLADIADECIFLVRRCDRESYDISEFPVEVDAFVQRLHHLINEVLVPV